MLLELSPPFLRELVASESVNVKTWSAFTVALNLILLWRAAEYITPLEAGTLIVIEGRTHPELRAEEAAIRAKYSRHGTVKGVTVCTSAIPVLEESCEDERGYPELVHKMLWNAKFCSLRGYSRELVARRPSLGPKPCEAYDLDSTAFVTMAVHAEAMAAVKACHGERIGISRIPRYCGPEDQTTRVCVHLAGDNLKRGRVDDLRSLVGGTMGEEEENEFFVKAGAGPYASNRFCLAFGS